MKTKRIKLRKFTNNDLNLIYQLDGDADVMRYITLGVPKSIKETKEYLNKRILTSYSDENNFGIFAAFLIKNNDFIGWFLFEKDKEVQRLKEVQEKLKKFVGMAADGRKKYGITGV